MVRITKFQKELFLKHKAAWVSGEWDFPEALTIPKMVEELSNGKTCKFLWDYCYGSISVFSQFAVSQEDGLLTGRAEIQIRTNFRNYLNKLEIYDKETNTDPV